MRKRVLAVAAALALGACGGGSSGSSPATPSNSPPSGNFSASPNPALLAATVVSLSASATDPEGDAITYSWDFGDGATASGQNVTHVFTREGTLSVVLTMRDSKGAQTTASNSVTVRSLTGHWVDSDPRYQVDLVQTGSTFTGSVSASGFGRVSNITNGVVSNPRSIACYRQSFVAGFATVDYTGTADSTLNTMHWVAVQTDRTTFDLTRQ